MTPERQLVQLFGCRDRQLDALRELVGGVPASHLRTVQLRAPVLGALVDGLSDANPRVRWWCLQVLDHVSEPRAVHAIAAALDDAVPRVRRNAAHTLGCVACKPGWSGALPVETVEHLARMAGADPNAKVRAEARRALAVHSPRPAARGPRRSEPRLPTPSVLGASLAARPARAVDSTRRDTSVAGPQASAQPDTLANVRRRGAATGVSGRYVQSGCLRS